MKNDHEQARRDFFWNATVLGCGLVLPGDVVWATPGSGSEKAAEKEEDVTPTEDLMREHGLLNRVLLIYQEAIRRLEGKHDMPPETLASAAGIIRHFIEDYHEKLEEEHLFPRFEKAHKLVGLVGTLREQHQAGRHLTAQVEQLATLAAFKNADDRRKLSQSLGAFIRMYRPHEAREDTVLFPALRSIVGPHEFAALGEQFDDKERELFGEEGFEKMVEKVAELEKTLGIYDLAQFTPR
jgi:hemerythrin-like domain-containing protein